MTGIQRRIFLTTTLVTLIGLFALFGLSVQRLNQATLEFYQHDLQSEALTVANSAAGVMEEFGEDEANFNDLGAWLTNQRSLNYHLTLLDNRGQILADTHASAVIGQAIETPEITAALAGRTEHYIRHDTAYTAAPITHEGYVVGVLRISAPMEPAYEEARHHWIEFAVQAVPVLLLTLAATLWLGQTIVHPIKKLNQSSLQIAGGAFNERIAMQRQDELGQLGQSFNYMAEQIEQFIARQRRFVSDAAHELRNPLMSLKLRVQAMQHEDLPPAQQQQYLQEVDIEIDRLAHLVTELLTLARLDEGRHVVELEPFDLTTFLHDTARHTRIQAQQAGLTFALECSDTLPTPAVSQPDLRMILDNLLSNAIKYTPSGGAISLNATCKAAQVILSVTDTGEGFSDENKDKLFDRFFRVDRSRNRQVVGTGLGLAIVKSLVEKANGTITAHSEGVGKGSVFTLTFPVLV